MVRIKYGLRTADYGPRNGYEIQTRYKTRTGKYGLGIKQELGIKRGLLTGYKYGLWTTCVKTVLIVLGKEIDLVTVLDAILTSRQRVRNYSDCMRI